MESRLVVTWRLWEWRLEIEDGREKDKETFWDDVYACYLDYGDISMGVCMCQFIKLYTLCGAYICLLYPK